MQTRAYRGHKCNGPASANVLEQLAHLRVVRCCGRLQADGRNGIIIIEPALLVQSLPGKADLLSLTCCRVRPIPDDCSLSTPGPRAHQGPRLQPRGSAIAPDNEFHAKRHQSGCQQQTLSDHEFTPARRRWTLAQRRPNSTGSLRPGTGTAPARPAKPWQASAEHLNLANPALPRASRSRVQ